MQLTFITPLRQAIDSLRIAQCAIENDQTLYARIDNLMNEIETIIEENDK